MSALIIVQQYYCNVVSQLSEFLKPLDSVPRSRRGWYFGAQLTGRPSLVRNNAVPGPPDYQTVPVCHGGGQNKAAFNCVNPRWTERDEDFRDPGLDTILLLVDCVASILKIFCLIHNVKYNFMYSLHVEIFMTQSE